MRPLAGGQRFSVSVVEILLATLAGYETCVCPLPADQADARRTGGVVLGHLGRVLDIGFLEGAAADSQRHDEQQPQACDDSAQAGMN
ncbi:hypothetical protein F3K53_05595 [Pseudomonas veronii]|uniref:Uncharacterized protein n=1 Tax=Pseudomonas veronii TaxID=76761 RepID=A0A5M8FJ66_PSEVE|nr:hypothetical protein F3K54_01445 [Pseudomonas veronii]KAA6184759.1 hypothetical protein F3K53_05595 [Pseudomonas veronii]